MQPDIFCPECKTYVGPNPECSCGWKRPQPLPSSGRPYWSIETPYPVASLTLLETTRGPLVLAGLGERGEVQGGMLALDPLSGQELWFYSTPGVVEGGAALLGDWLVFGDEAGNLHALDLDGKLLWRNPISVGGAIRTSPLPDSHNDVVVYVSTASREVLSLDIRRPS